MQDQAVVTKGCDPEVFLIDGTGKFISSIGLIGGSKEFPRPIGEGCAIQEDNVAVEFNTPPCNTADDFVKSINYNLNFIKEQVAKMGLQIAVIPSAVFDSDQLANPSAKVFGCDPDYNAWLGGKRNPRPRASDANLRSAGGHIHIQLPEGVDHIEVVKAMDWFVGCQMLRFDTDKDRRKLYGKPGAFRKKPYGVEYRTASNKWIESEERIRWVWAQTDKAVQFVQAGNVFSDELGQMIQDCINNSDLDILAKLEKELPL